MVITADFETRQTKPFEITTSYEIINQHILVSYRFKVCIIDDNVFKCLPKEYRKLVNHPYIYCASDDNENVGTHFLNRVHTVCNLLMDYIIKTNIPMQMTDDNIKEYYEAETCYCCFNSFKLKKYEHS